LLMMFFNPEGEVRFGNCFCLQTPAVNCIITL
jgi:hypothetical protein